MVWTIVDGKVRLTIRFCAIFHMFSFILYLSKASDRRIGSPAIADWVRPTGFAPKRPAYRYIILLPLSGALWGEQSLFAPKPQYTPFPAL